MTVRRTTVARVVLLAIGLGIIGALVWQTGPVSLGHSLQAVGARSVLVLPPYLLVFLINALAWRQAFIRPRPVGLGRLTEMQVIGKAINLATPLLPVGGEPVKAHLLGQLRVPLTEAPLLTIAQGVFIVAVVALALAVLDLPARLLQQALAGVLIGAVLVGIFVLTQTRGLFGRVAALLGRAGLGPAALGPGAQDLDRLVAGYYRDHRRRGAVAILLHVAAFVAEAIEVYVVLSLLRLPASPIFALTVTALSSVVRAAAFVMPAGLGIQEGGNVVIFVSLGLSPESALAFSLLRRFREVAWALAGFVLLGKLGFGRHGLRVSAPGGPPCAERS